MAWPSGPQRDKEATALYEKLLPIIRKALLWSRSDEMAELNLDEGLRKRSLGTDRDSQRHGGRLPREPSNPVGQRPLQV